ncbi:phenylalanine--tRNA ligase subunit beta [Candidatus Liberibacter africanus]|uniref:Phenylalanine--tRNA ligase beta subunit n=1 Tax=Candidatus Liberibacter africanus PTSAPSY TaxID=1277257 RepID=A0A0G3I626_LIBAF|nr:phenylalanine--tRNA ligase subunit beta [Candidatus Liberibacter africanus]AKK19883.1 phenylalanyl-tRNA synthetase subunit beta [Candidatus Liberibacter africanus PTSAPSY]QTP63737.1 phenylalanine--tRNA ligase subunit beta [Candidatus Liberibacter africanus]
MKFTLSWLKDHLDTDVSIEKICDKLTSIGLEVEKVDDRSSLIPFTIVKILSVEQNADSDHLSILQIDVGKQDPIQVVCGAPNVRVGLLGVWAPPGSCIPESNKKIDVSTIRGVKSAGMMCSEKELMLSNNCSNIMELPIDAPVGGKLIDYLGLSDPIIDVSLTPNRADCTGVRGIAFDLAATGLGKFKEIDTPIFSSSESFPLEIRLDLDDANLCQGFAMCCIKGVRNGVAPDWMRRRLEAVGLRSISTLVDITNYISLDRGYPSHVFDASKIVGDLTIRRARIGEKILALNDQEYDLSSNNVVVASDDVVESIAGIIGGKHASCDNDTIDVLLEVALWDPRNIAHSGHALGINTDSRYRFERGVDSQDMIPIMKHAVSLVLSLCGGKASDIHIAKNKTYKPHKISFMNSDVKRLAGIDVPVEDSLRILEKLGFYIEEGKGAFTVSAPSWRGDVEEKADLVEEILRIYGVDRITSKPLPLVQVEDKRPLSVQQNRIRYAKRVLASRAMMEVITWSFISKEQSVLFGGGHSELEILNPISVEMSDMRTSLFPGLLKAVNCNVDRSIADLSIFEVSHVYENDRPEGQKCMAAGIRKGSSCIEGFGRFWFEKSGARCRNVDVFDAKADALAVLEPFVSVDSLHIEPVAPSWYHPGLSGTIKLGKTVLGYFGEFHPQILYFFGLSNPICGFEIYIDSIPVSQKKRTKTKGILHLSSLHPIKRDFSFVVDRSVPSSMLVDAVKKVDCNIITDVRVFDVFSGESLGIDKKSVALEVSIQPMKETLRDDEIQELTKRIIENVFQSTNAVLRSS